MEIRCSTIVKIVRMPRSHVHCQVLPRSQCHDPHAGIFASSQAAVETSRVNGLSQGMKGNREKIYGTSPLGGCATGRDGCSKTHHVRALEELRLQRKKQTETKIG